MTFRKLAEVFDRLERVSSGNKMREIVSGLLKSTPLSEMKAVVYLMMGQIGPISEDIDLGVGIRMAEEAMAMVSTKDLLQVKAETKKLGDPGKVILRHKSARKDAELRMLFVRGKVSVNSVYEGLRKVARISGEGSNEKKVRMVAAILQAVSALEAKYVVRVLLGDLKLGVGSPTILDSLSLAFFGDKGGRKDLERAFNVSSDLGDVAYRMKKSGLVSVSRMKAKVGSPIRMMAAQRVGKMADLLEKIDGPMVCEEKYDGERVQIHMDKGKVKIFSRNLEVITDQFPDVVEAVLRGARKKRFIVEGEVVAVDAKGRLGKFHDLMQRRRKYGVEDYVKKVPVMLYLFDMLYVDGRSILHEDYSVRRGKLEKSFNARLKMIAFARRYVGRNLAKIEDFFKQSLARGGEGIIAKAAGEHSVYRAGARAWLWIKWKKDYATELADTLDLVVVGAYAGRGRRSGKYGALLMACYEKKADEFRTLSRLGAGFSDKEIGELPKMLLKYKSKKRPARVNVRKGVEPDVWFRPKVVMEVLVAELSASPNHTCGLGEMAGGKGLAARFPRFVKMRSDKAAEQATSEVEIKQMYERQ